MKKIIFGLLTGVIIAARPTPSAAVTINVDTQSIERTKTIPSES